MKFVFFAVQPDSPLGMGWEVWTDLNRLQWVIELSAQKILEVMLPGAMPLEGSLMESWSYVMGQTKTSLAMGDYPPPKNCKW